MEARGPKKLPKWTPKSVRKVKESKILEKVKTCKKHSIYYVLSTCSLCAGVGFLEEIVKKRCRESSLRFLAEKTRQSRRFGPKVVPKGAQKPPILESLFVKFLHLGYLWPSLTSLGGPGCQNGPQRLQNEAQKAPKVQFLGFP